MSCQWLERARGLCSIWMSPQRNFGSSRFELSRTCDPQIESGAMPGVRPASIIPRSSAPKLSNNIIQKGLAFGRRWSGTVANSGRSEILPRRLHGRGGASVVRRDAAINQTEDLDVKVCEEAITSASTDGSDCLSRRKSSSCLNEYCASAQDPDRRGASRPLSPWPYFGTQRSRHGLKRRDNQLIIILPLTSASEI
jgi:hypothetical protein